LVVGIWWRGKNSWTGTLTSCPPQWSTKGTTNVVTSGTKIIMTPNIIQILPYNDVAVSYLSTLCTNIPWAAGETYTLPANT
jgi:hypothetical protein